MPFVVIVIIFISIYQAGSDVNNKNNNRKLNYKHLIRYDTRCYFNVRSKADMSRLNLRHGDDN